MEKKLEKPYCVWDAIYGDFLENFKTLKGAKEYCHKQIEKGIQGIYIVGKWLCNDRNSSEYDSSYKEICRIFK